MEDFYPSKNHGPDSGIGSDNGDKRLSTTEVRIQAHSIACLPCQSVFFSPDCQGKQVVTSLMCEHATLIAFCCCKSFNTLFVYLLVFLCSRVTFIDKAENHKISH